VLLDHGGRVGRGERPTWRVSHLRSRVLRWRSHDTRPRSQPRRREKPETGKIAVKVINDYGDEVMKIIDA
jgi:hypothetical protein